MSHIILLPNQEICIRHIKYCWIFHVTLIDEILCISAFINKVFPEGYHVFDTTKTLHHSFALFNIQRYSNATNNVPLIVQLLTSYFLKRK